jgi:hypothetical protein
MDTASLIITLESNKLEDVDILNLYLKNYGFFQSDKYINFLIISLINGEIEYDDCILKLKSLSISN